MSFRFDDFSITKFSKFKLRIHNEYVDYTKIEINEIFISIDISTASDKILYL